MLLESVLINFICNCVLCMHEFAFMYDYVYMSLCFILMSMHAYFTKYTKHNQTNCLHASTTMAWILDISVPGHFSTDLDISVLGTGYFGTDLDSSGLGVGWDNIKTTISGIDLHWNYQKHISIHFWSYIKELLVQKYWQLISTKQLWSVPCTPFIIYKGNYANYEIQRVC
jgi:hypothetical protein